MLQWIIPIRAFVRSISPIYTKMPKSKSHSRRGGKTPQRVKPRPQLQASAASLADDAQLLETETQSVQVDNNNTQGSNTVGESKTPQLENFQEETQSSEESSNMKKKINKVLLDDEKEDELVEWIKANPILYDKSLKGYKNKAEKDAKWRSKSEEIGINGETNFEL